MSVLPQNTLATLKIGQKALVTGFTDEALSLKLLEMGCLPGAEIEMHAIAPLGDPLCISVYGYKLSMRISEANTVLIKII